MINSIKNSKFNFFIENINKHKSYNLFKFYKLIGLSYINPYHLIEKHTPNQIRINTCDDIEFYTLNYYFKFSNVSFDDNLIEWIKMIFMGINPKNISFNINSKKKSISLRIKKTPLFFNQDTFWLKLFYRYYMDSSILSFSNSIFKSVLFDYDFLIHHNPLPKMIKIFRDWNWERKRDYIMIIEQSNNIQYLLYNISILNSDIKSIIYLYL
jgi:hypothetical protein